MSRRVWDLYAPFAGKHNPLRGGWSTEQLDTVADALGTTKPTTAFVACSLIAEQRTTGRPLRYSRSQKNYSYLDVFQGDPLMTYRRVVPAADWLVKHGYAEHHMGVWEFKKQSIISATPKLMALAHLVDINQRKGAMLKDEIILRDNDRNPIPFHDTDEIKEMRVEMQTINAHLTQQRYFTGDLPMYVLPAARIFNRDFHRGGRLYHQGPSYQQMKKADRAEIQMLVDGEVSPMVELDFESLHMRLAYTLAGKAVPPGDLYAVEGFTRPLAKVATLIALNADGTEVGAIISALKEDEDLAVENRLYQLSPSALKTAVKRLVEAIKHKHFGIQELFGTGVGAQLMKADSDIAVKIMLKMIEQTGRCPLVVHDSFLVPEQDTDLLQKLMLSALTTSSAADPSLPTRPISAIHSSPSIYLGKHCVDQAGSVPLQFLRQKVLPNTPADLHHPGSDPPTEDREHRHKGFITA